MTSLKIPIVELLGDDIKTMLKEIVKEGLDEIVSELHPRDFMNQREALEWLGVGYQVLKKMEALGYKPFIVDGRKIYSKRELTAFMEANK